MTRDREDNDPIHFGFDTWGSTKISTTWRGRLIMLLLRVVIDTRQVDISIIGMLRQDELGLCIFFTTRPQEKGIQSTPD